jgi:hypothetical protein
MVTDDQADEMAQAWTYAVLDALEAAEPEIRLEVARILCPAGFIIVPNEPEPSSDSDRATPATD